MSAEAAFRFLADPRCRPQWQSSLRSVDVPADEEPHLGQRWSETTAVGVRPALETTVFTPFRVWAETGHLARRHGDPRAALHRRRRRLPGAAPRARSAGSGAWAVPAGAAGLLASKAIAADLRKAGRILAARG